MLAIKNNILYKKISFIVKKHSLRTRDIIFIVGKPRSGTTWLLSLLENHTDCLGITPSMLEIETIRPTKETGLFARNLSDEEIIHKINLLPKNKKMVEKTPSHLFYIDKIKEILPQSKIILIKRNSLDVIYSMIQPNEFWSNSPKNISEATALYNKFSKAESNYLKYIDYTINYEDLWNNTETELTRLMDYLEIDTNQIPKLIKKTKDGKNLPDTLKKVFRTGTPGQHNFNKKEINYIKHRIS
jgi:hypothetical protein